MSKIANDVMKDVCQLSLQDELERMSKLNIDNIVYQKLSTQQVNQLARKIGLLPSEYRNILFLGIVLITALLKQKKHLKQKKL